MEEVWKDVCGYEGRYRISNMGRLMSCNAGNGTRDKIVKPQPNEKGYLMVHLYDYGRNKTVKVHRLVAQAFVPNPNNLPEVNHIDADRKNNRADNLEWVTRQANVTDAKNRGSMDSTFEKLRAHNRKNQIPVVATDKASGVEKEYESINAAARACSVPAIHICNCLNGKRKSSGGFTFRKVGDK